MIFAPAWQWMSSMIASVPAVICSGTCPCWSSGRDNPLQQLIGHLVTDGHLAMHPGFAAIQAALGTRSIDLFLTVPITIVHICVCVNFIRAEGLQRICKDCVKGFTTVWVLCAGINLPYFAVQFSFMAAAASAIRKAPLTLHCGYPFGGEWHEQWLSKTQWFMSHDASVSSGSHVRWCSNWNIQRSLAGLNYSIAIAGKDLDL